MIERIKRLPFVVRLLQKKHPSNSTCMICGTPWASCDHHIIMMRPTSNLNSGAGFFPVCEWCWNHRGYEENRQAVMDTYKMWERGRDRDGNYEIPYTLETMLAAFEIDWEQTHRKYEKRA